MERPASVVKELMENAIDAGASSITVEVEEGGKRLLRVLDNGCGMPREDVELALVPHATSKIYDEKGLKKIETLGFRGEALASIGAVSELTLSSRSAKSVTGWQIRSIFGRFKKVKPTGMPPGTEALVENIFLEIPARLKFLKRRQTELSHIAMKVRIFAVIYPHIQFKLISEGRVLFRNNTSAQGPEKLTPLIGEDLSRRLLKISSQEKQLRIKGYISSPTDCRSSSRAFYFFLNGRPVSDKLLWKAVMEAGRGFFMKGSYPAGAVYIEIPPELVDVNVHPAKHEVRFHDSNQIFRLMFQAIKRTLESSGNRDESISTTAKDSLGDNIAVSNFSSHKQKNSASGTDTDSENSVQEIPLPWEKKGEKTRKFPLNSSFTEHTSEQKHVSPTLPSYSDVSREIDKNEYKNSKDIGQGSYTGYSSFDIIGQFDATYVIAQTENKLVLVDQHAAHEAILFKRMMREIKNSESSISQPLVFPEVVERSPSDIARLESVTGQLKDLGIAAEKFGDAQIIIKAIPYFLANEKEGVKEAVNIIDSLIESPDTQIDSTIHEIVASFACRLAIKAGQLLKDEELRSLFFEMDEESVKHCPHGRPIAHIITLDEIEKKFGRKK